MTNSRVAVKPVEATVERPGSQGKKAEFKKAELKKAEFPILDEVRSILTERQSMYGKSEDSFSTIASFWTTYLDRVCGLDIPVSAKDVAMLMSLMKIARETNKHKHDNLVDIIGYISHADRISLKETCDYTTCEGPDDLSDCKDDMYEVSGGQLEDDNFYLEAEQKDDSDNKGGGGNAGSSALGGFATKQLDRYSGRQHSLF